MRRILFFLTVIFVYFLANYYVFSHMGNLIQDSSLVVKGCFLIITGFLSASFILFFLFSKKIPVYLSVLLYKISTGWMIVLIYAFILFLLFDGFTFINDHLKLIPETMVYSWYSIGIIAALIGLVCLYGFINYLKKRRIFLQLTTLKELKKPVKIAVISDLHLGYAIRNLELQQWTEKINREKPDILLIVGDIVDNSVRPLDYFKMDEYFKEIQAPLGIYTCLGNHEYLSGVGDSVRFIKKAGIHLLRDSTALIDDNFYLVGRDDRTNPHRKPLSELLKDLDQSKPVILLDHQPFYLEEAEENGIDIQLSGHTHRGQVWPLSLIADAMYETAHGYLKKGNTHVYVSSGIGIWGGRYRIGTQSEYVIIEFSKE